jgi:FlaA1/EpsC-like NDP-sugar epimerase
MKKFQLSRFAISRAAVLVLFYSVCLSLSLWIAYLLRFDFYIPDFYLDELIRMLLWIVPLKLFLLAGFRQFEGLLSYFSLPDLRRLFLSTSLSSTVVIAVWIASAGGKAPPRGVILTDFVLSFLGLAMVRLAFRLLRERYTSEKGRSQKALKRVGIIGAGDVGASLARELLSKPGLGLLPVVFFDDSEDKWRSRVHNIPVVGPPEMLKNHTEDLQLEEIIIAMPNAAAKRIGEIVKVLQSAHLKFGTVPSIDQLATGQVKVTQLRSVEIQDLLGRDSVQLETENIRDILAGCTIMVTGAGGSIGSELCRQIALFHPKRLLLVDQSEVHLFQIEQELIEKGHGAILCPQVADILDHGRMSSLFARYKPSILFHAAAHKHVPMMEAQPGEAIKNNTLGTARLAELALHFETERFVLISTDKAINPTSVMGASKRMAEIFLQSLYAKNASKTKFMAVRFGNVLGSSGSVVPIFNRQIAAGGPVRVTHPDVTRYFMTIPEAVGLVLQSAAQGSGGEIFVLDMGHPVKIVDLARQLIELSGLVPDEDIEIEFIGLRPGEKLFEELSHYRENVTPTHHPKIMRFVSSPQPLDKAQEVLTRLEQNLHITDPNQIRLILKQAVPEYAPFLT